MPTGTVRLHRVLRTTPEKAYRAFTHGAALAKWLPPYGFVCHVHAFDGQVGGRFKMSFENFSTGQSHAFGDPNLPGEMHVTVKLRAVSCGTEVHIEQAGIPEIIPTEACYLGWQESLAQLAQLVEPEITE
jgi:uncharacterized protein YndB with AHSA1/START domain